MIPERVTKFATTLVGFACAVWAAERMALVATAATVQVQNTQGMGVRLIHTASTSTTTKNTTYDKSFVRGLTNTTTGDQSWGKVWLQFDLTNAWATYGKENLSSATLTIWGENGTGRRFSVAGLSDNLGLEGWDMNTLSWDNAPGNDVNSGTAIDFSKVYNAAPLWTVQTAATDSVVTDLGSSAGGSSDPNFDQAARYTSLVASPSIADFLKTDSDGKVTLIGYDHTNSSNQNWWTGITGLYANDVSNGLVTTGGERLRDSPTLTLVFVPEPASLALVGFATALLLIQRRRTMG